MAQYNNTPMQKKDVRLSDAQKFVVSELRKGGNIFKGNISGDFYLDYVVGMCRTTKKMTPTIKKLMTLGVVSWSNYTLTEKSKSIQL